MQPNSRDQLHQTKAGNALTVETRYKRTATWAILMNLTLTSYTKFHLSIYEKREASTKMTPSFLPLQLQLLDNRIQSRHIKTPCSLDRLLTEQLKTITLRQTDSMKSTIHRSLPNRMIRHRYPKTLHVRLANLCNDSRIWNTSSRLVDLHTYRTVDSRCL